MPKASKKQVAYCLQLFRRCHPAMKKLDEASLVAEFGRIVKIDPAILTSEEAATLIVQFQKEASRR